MVSRKDQLLGILAVLDGHFAADDISLADADRWRELKRHIVRMKDALDLVQTTLREEHERGIPLAPTLEELRRDCPWCWVVCERCLRRTPVAFLPLIIRWGPNASSDLLRRSARCTKCCSRGATLQHPSWAGRHVGFEPFPVN